MPDRRPTPWSLVLGLLALSGPLAAQDASAPAGPLTTLGATYGFTTQDGPGDEWTTAQRATLGLSARWGSGLKLDGQLNAPFDGSPLTADGLVQQMALTWTVNDWSVVTFGKQRLKWGTARVFSAVDGLEPTFDPLSPQAVLDGVTGMKFEVLPTDWLSVSALVLPTRVLQDSKRALRFDVLWDDADLSAGAIHSVANGVQRGAFYADFARFFDRFGVYGEAELKTFRDRDWALTDASGTTGLKNPDFVWTPKATVGLQVEFPVWLNGTLRWLTEYHFNGEGFTPDEATAFGRAWKVWKQAPKTTPPSVGISLPQALSVGTFSRHYGYTGLSGLPVTEKLSLGAWVIAGLDTGFILAHGSAWYEVDQGLSVGLDYGRFDTWPGTSGNPSERMLIPQTNQVTLTVSGSY